MLKRLINPFIPRLIKRQIGWPPLGGLVIVTTDNKIVVTTDNKIATVGK